MEEQRRCGLMINGNSFLVFGSRRSCTYDVTIIVLSFSLSLAFTLLMLNSFITSSILAERGHLPSNQPSGLLPWYMICTSYQRAIWRIVYSTSGPPTGIKPLVQLTTSVICTFLTEMVPSLNLACSPGRIVCIEFPEVTFTLPSTNVVFMALSSV